MYNGTMYIGGYIFNDDKEVTWLTAGETESEVYKKLMDWFNRYSDEVCAHGTTDYRMSLPVIEEVYNVE